MKQINNKNSGIRDILTVCIALAVIAVFTAGILSAVNSVKPRKSVPANTVTVLPENTTEKEAEVTVDPLLTLVNAEHPLPEDWQINLVDVGNGHSVDERVADALLDMLHDAEKKGLDPVICSSYRNEERQTELFENKIQDYMALGYSEKEAEKLAKTWVNEPGTSEHATGLAVDIVAYSYQLLEKEQENTEAQKWLMKNCWKYGFILRYPEGKEDITGVNYEPWHYRYVGKKYAREIMKSGLCLEEYLEKTADRK